MPLVSRTFDQLIDFTRTSSATFVGSNGLIQSTPQSRNLLTFTQEFDNAAWTKLNVTVTANSTAAPDGTLTADKLVENTATDQHRVNATYTFPSTSPHTLSVFAKAAERSWLRVNNGSDNLGAFFNLSTGVVGTASVGVTATITAVGNGWYRCAVTFTPASAAAKSMAFNVSNADNVSSYTGDGTSGIYVWGAQLELGSTASDYTRNYGGLFPPRFDYDPVTLAPRGLLIEEQRTNLLTYSEQFDNAAWTKSNSTVTADATTSPDGTVDADALVENTATSAHEIVRSFSVTSGSTYTYGVFIKAAGRSRVRIQFSASHFPATALAYFDTTTGAPDNVGVGATATMAALGNGWYRCMVTATATATATSTVFTSLISAGTTSSYTGDGTSGIFLWGAQLEAGAFATSYIPTAASQVTRTADTALIQAPNFAPWYNQSEGTFVAGYDILGFSANQRMFSLNDNTVNNEAALFSSTGSNRLIAVAGGVIVATPTGLSPITAGVVYTSALGFKLDDFGIAVNGNAAVTDSSGAMPSGIVKLNLGSNTLNSNILNGHLRSIRYYPTRLSDAQLQALTA